MKKVIRVLAIALCVSALSFGAIIDDFGVNQALISDSIIGGVPTTSVLGNRTLHTNLITGTASSSAEISAGQFYGNTAATATSTSGTSYTGLWNLTTAYANNLTLDVVSLEGYTGGSIEFYIKQGTNTANYVMGVPAIGPISANLDFFTGIGGVNRTLVDQIGFTFSHTLAQDIVLDNFEIQYVPEPGTYAMMAAGLLGLFAIRRKRA